MANIGAPGKEQFRDMIMEVRNRHIIAGMNALLPLRTEVLASDELARRTGVDKVTKDHWTQLLVYADRIRRRVTYNPNSADIGTQIEKAIDASQQIETDPKPFATDNVESGSVGLIQLPWAFDGSDVNIPINSQLTIPTGAGNALLLVGAIDSALVAWTRLESRMASRGITQMDSMRIYQRYQEILEYLETIGGDDNFLDVANPLPQDEPRGLEGVANRVTEKPGVPGSSETL